VPAVSSKETRSRPSSVLPPGVTPSLAHKILVENVRFAATELQSAGLRLPIEPVNSRDIPGFLLDDSQQALEIIAEVGSGNLLLQQDIYHMQVMEGDLAGTITENLSRIGYVQIADNPGRHEPGTGEINYTFLFEALDRERYTGWIGCDYNALSSPVPASAGPPTIRLQLTISEPRATR